jgi:hypothetical protein
MWLLINVDKACASSGSVSIIINTEESEQVRNDVIEADSSQMEADRQ